MLRLNNEINALLTEENLKILFQANVFTTLDFIKTDINRITGSSNLSYKDVITLKKYIANKSAAVTKNGLSYYKEILYKSSLISTGIKRLDSLLEGGFLSGQIYEICGLPATGKTQLCMTIVKNVALLGKHVYYLDTKNDFSGRRLKEMLENTENISEDQIPLLMSRILVKRICSKYDLVSALYDIKDEILKDVHIPLIIIDSLPAIFYHNTSNYIEMNGMLNHFLNIARFLAVECYVAVIITNILTTWYEGDFRTQSDSAFTEKIGLGKYWSSIPNTRLIVRRAKGNAVCDIIVSKYDIVSEKSCELLIKNCGVV